MRLPIDTKDGESSIRIGFTDQRLTAHGGMIVWSHFLRQKGFRRQLHEVLPHEPTRPNAYDLTDVALFSRAAVWSRAGGKPTLKLAVRGAANRNWWREMLEKLTALPNCHAVASLQA